jgi:hypothetical protein
MNKSAYAIKSGIVFLLLLGNSFYLTYTLVQYALTEQYFSPPISLLGTIAVFMLTILYLYALSVGGWKTWEQYALVALPIALGVFGGTMFLSPSYAIIVGVVALALVSYDTLIASKVKEQLIKFAPRIILRFALRGLLTMFSLVGAFLVFIHAARVDQKVDLGSKIGGLVQQQVVKIVEPQLAQKVPANLLSEIEGRPLPMDPELFTTLGGEQFDSNSMVGGLPALNLDLEKTVENEFNKLIEPYKQFLPPLMGILAFALIRFLGSIAYIGYGLTVDLLFLLFKKIGFLHAETVPAEKEVITF